MISSTVCSIPLKLYTTTEYDLRKEIVTQHNREHYEMHTCNHTSIKQQLNKQISKISLWNMVWNFPIAWMLEWVRFSTLCDKWIIICHFDCEWPFIWSCFSVLVNRILKSVHIESTTDLWIIANICLFWGANKLCCVFLYNGFPFGSKIKMEENNFVSWIQGRCCLIYFPSHFDSLGIHFIPHKFNEKREFQPMEYCITAVSTLLSCCCF